MSEQWRQRLESPCWLPHRLDILGDRMLVAEVDEQICHRATFLEGESFKPKSLHEVQGLWSAVEAHRPLETPSIGIFHVGHCGSTLLSRALQDIADVTALREPAIFRMAAGFVRDRNSPLALMSPERCDSLLATLFDWLSRRYEPTRPSVVKATSDCCNIATHWLEHHQHNRMVALTMKAESFLATMLRSTIREEETRGFAVSRLADYHRLVGSSQLRLSDLDSSSLTALSWITTTAQLIAATEQYASRTQLIDFEDWLGSPVVSSQAIAEHLELAVQRDKVDPVITGLLSRYSKDGSLQYGVAQRNEELNHFRSEKASQIASGLHWIEAALRKHPQLQPLSDWL